MNERRTNWRKRNVIMAVCASKYQQLGFTAAYLIFHSIFFSLYIFFERLTNGSRRRLETVAKFQRILNPLWGVGTIQIYLAFPKLCFLFQLFQVEWKTHMASFLDNNSANSRIVCGLWDLRIEGNSPHNLVFVFWKCITYKKKDVEYLRHHSTDFRHVFTKMIEWMNELINE